jgi:endonuclease/exonuclease/phosphatase family metal-dependent hydrolase
MMSLSPPPAHTIRIASYNIRKAVGTDRRRNPERILAVLAEVDADIVALQEADRRFGARASALPVALLDHHSDYQPAPLNIHGQHRLAWQRDPPPQIGGTEAQCDILHLPCLEPRGAVVADIRLFGPSTSA